MPTVNRPTQQDRFRKIIAAIPKHLTSFSSIVIAGITFNPDSLVQFFQAQIKLLDDATAAKAKLHEAVVAIVENTLKNGVLLLAFNDWIRATFVHQPTVLSDFGVAARKARMTTVQTKAIAVQKNLATREARHTMGPRQRKAVKGVVAHPVDLGTSESASLAPTESSAPVAPAAPPAVVPTGTNGMPPAHTP